MSQQKVAKAIDLNTHLHTDPKTAHGIWANVRAAIAGVYNALWRDNTDDETADVYFQSGVDGAPVGSDATITFDVEFTAAPRVVVSVNNATQDANVNVHTITTASFKMRLFNRTSGSTLDCTWIAIGRKDR